MKPAKFDHQRPGDLAQAVAALSRADGFAKILAGGQSLVPMMNLRLAQPDMLIDIDGLEGLRRIEDRGDRLFIGALVTHAMIEDGAVPDITGGMLPRVASQIAYRAVRNRGTVGGAIAHADPSADWPAALLALGAEAVVSGPGGQRTAALEKLQLGPFTVALEPEEIIEGLVVPKLSARARWGYYKVCRKPGEFAESIGALVIDPERDFARLVLGATDGAPLLLAEAAGRIAASDGDGFAIEDAKAALAGAGAAFDTYKTQIHAVALSRAVKGAFAR